ncbi:unnamed protein product [Trichogramma brassicae]|uniref:Reverse transcriptase domain-containing protein n=1 Tax=Trichogramma brassicae TaxID=86971 RepID=A0A6H5I9V3_9HYME|nr:unnamed protein product [Trichogramma brassicae]
MQAAHRLESSKYFWANVTLRFHGHCTMREEAIPHIKSRQTIHLESIGFSQKLVSSIITQIHCRTTATSARSRTIKTRATVSSSSLYPNAKKSLGIEATAAAEASTATKAKADAAESRQQSGIIGIIIRARRSKRGVGGGGAYARTGGLRALRAARDLLSLLLRLIYLGLLSWSSLCSWLRQGLARLPYSPVTRRPNVSGSVVGGHQSSARVVCGAGSGPHHHHPHHPHASHHHHHQRHRQHQHRRHRHLAAAASCTARLRCKESRARETPRIAFDKNIRLLPKLILIPTLRASPVPHYTARAAALYASPGPSLHAHCTGGSSSSSNYAPVPSLLVPKRREERGEKEEKRPRESKAVNHCTHVCGHYKSTTSTGGPAAAALAVQVGYSCSSRSRRLDISNETFMPCGCFCCCYCYCHYIPLCLYSIVSVLDSHAPQRITVLKPKAKPWITAELRSLMHARDRAYRIYKRRRTAEALAAYRLHRRILKNRLDSAKNDYISHELVSAASPNKYWSVLKRIGVTAKRNPSPLTYFSSETLCQHFARVSSASPPLTSEIVRSLLSVPLPRTTPSFSFARVTAADVLSAMARCTSSSTGPDGIPLSVLKLASSTLAEHIANLANRSFESGTFPSAWKLSSVVALSKCSAPSSPSDTRPISLLAELSKIVERLAHAQLSDHLSRHSLLDPQQHGFRPGHSTQTALLDLTESVRMAVDKPSSPRLRRARRGVVFELPEQPLHVGQERGWRSLRPTIHHLSGIPQGSSLGPLLFAIFINDLHTALRHSKHIIYADDTAIFQHHFPSKIHELIADLNADANAVAAWAAENKLHLNPSKTTVMILGSLAYVSSIDKAAIPKITLNGTSIAYSSSIKCLGVTISPTLLWTKHINSLRSKCHFALYSLRFYRHALNRQLRARLAVALVLPHLDYAAAVYNDISATSDLRLQRLQNACVRFVFDLYQLENTYVLEQQLERAAYIIYRSCTSARKRERETYERVRWFSCERDWKKIFMCAINCEACQAYTRARYIYVERAAAAAAIRTRMFQSGHLMTACASFDAIIHLWIYCYATRTRGSALLQQRGNIDAIITTKWNHDFVNGGNFARGPIKRGLGIHRYPRRVAARDPARRRVYTQSTSQRQRQQWRKKDTGSFFFAKAVACSARPRHAHFRVHCLSSRTHLNIIYCIHRIHLRYGRNYLKAECGRRWWPCCRGLQRNGHLENLRRTHTYVRYKERGQFLRPMYFIANAI